MSKTQVNNAENKHERADRIARELILAERQKRERKTARLRALRLEVERAGI